MSHPHMLLSGQDGSTITADRTSAHAGVRSTHRLRVESSALRPAVEA